MRSLGDVLAEPADEVEAALAEDNCGREQLMGLARRRGSLESVDRLSLGSAASALAGYEQLGGRTLRSLKRGLGRLWRRHRGNASITEYDPSYKVAYLGNVLTSWAKGEGCVEKPVSTLWGNYVGSSRPDVSMRLTVTNGGLTATTKDHGLTEYWAHRVTYCTAPVSHPRLFVWVYRHEGRRLKPELRCHAALCAKESTARRLASVLNARLHQALLEFRRDKVSRQNARLSLANSVYENPSLPRRKLLLSTGGSNYRPPLERSKSAPKLSAIEEDAAAEELEQQRFLDELERAALGRAHQVAVARRWRDEGWRLARLLDALHRESSDENGSISSGCETASTANSEERAGASSGEDNHQQQQKQQHHRHHRRAPMHEAETTTAMGQRTSGEALTQAMTTSGLIGGPSGNCQQGPRRNSEGSPNFMTCAGSPRFRRRSSRHQTRARSRKLGCLAVGGSTGSSLSLSRSEGEESLEEDEDEDAMAGVEDALQTGVPAIGGDYFEFEDAEDMDEIVDFRPHGESPRSPCGSGASATSARLQNDGYAALLARRDDVRKLMTSRRANVCRDEIDGCCVLAEASPPASATHPCPRSGTTNPGQRSPAKGYRALGSLDEEEAAADSDESGYVEASPKSSIDRADLKCGKKELLPDKTQQQQQQQQQEHGVGDRAHRPEPGRTARSASSPAEQPESIAEFIKCPISETIKKLANASLRSSKRSTARQEGAPAAARRGESKGATPHEFEGESPSLVQRKLLLAQRGVTV